MIEQDESLSVVRAGDNNRSQANSEGDLRDRLEALVREAMTLYQQNHLSEALLACEGALTVDPDYIPALSLKGLIHERLGQKEQAIAAYEQVLRLNPLSVAERERIEALRRKVNTAVVQASRPLWLETLPVLFAFLSAGLVLLLGFLWAIRAGVSTSPAPPPVASTAAPLSEPNRFASSTPTLSNTPPHVPSPPPSSPVPPVLVDPSRLALSPQESPRLAPPAGAIASPSAPNSPSQNPQSESASRIEPPSSSTNESGEVLPDVRIQEKDPGVYEIQVIRRGEPNGQSPRASGNVQDQLDRARSYQMAGNYQAAIEAYLRALPNAPSPGDVHQQIAICYLRLNDKARARTHFQQAITAYERQIEAGREVESARQGIAACRNGLLLCEE